MSAAPQPSATHAAVNPAEVDRLHTLLDRQPTCLMRIGLDGTLLAVNDVGLDLLGARRLAQVFGTSIVQRIASDGDATWTTFVGRVAENGSASTECELKDLSGASRVVTLRAVSLPAHPDGVESLFVTFRDVSTARRLETSLREQEAHTRAAQVALAEAASRIEQLEARLNHVTRDREQLAQTLAELKRALITAIDATLLAQAVVDKGKGA